MKYERYCLVSGVVFFFVALGHLLRIVYGMPLIVADVATPMFASWIALIVTVSLAAWAFRIAKSLGVD